ncbi:MAG: glycosyltransferase [Burkholderiaceae bacterium]
MLLRAFAALDAPRGHARADRRRRSAPACRRWPVRSAWASRCTSRGSAATGSLAEGLDAFVLPSSLEGIPRCLMEAMAARVPIVSSDIPGSRDLVTHDQTGLPFALDDVARWWAQPSARPLAEPGWPRV